MIFAGPSSTFTCSASLVTAGLVGTVGVRIVDKNGNSIKARTTSGITEPIANSGFYVATINLATLPSAPTPGHYYVFWDDGSVAPSHNAPEDLYITGNTSLGTALRNIHAVANTTDSPETMTIGIFVP